MELGPGFSYDRCHFSRKGPLKQKPLAVVRFTAYDDSYREVLKVNESNYPNNRDGIDALKGQIIAALDAGFDVSILTPCDVDSLIKLLDFANQS